jgi:phosphoglycerol transferase
MSFRTASPVLRDLLLYGFAVVLCSLILVKYFGLHRHSLRVPLQYSKDSLVHLNLIKNTVDTGWFIHNDSLGAPGGQDLRGLPFPDTLHHLVIKGMTYFSHDVFLIGNLFYLLTFPLTTITSLFVLRKLGIRNSLALGTSLLYTYLPYHYLRLEHLYLAAYYHLPPVCLMAIRLYQGRAFLANESEDRSRSLADWLFAGLTCVLLGLGGVYYAFFGCWLFLVAGLAGALSCRSWAPAWRASGLITGTFAAFLVAVMPSLLMQFNEGNSADDVVRPASESEWYGLKVAQMLMPIQDHQLPLLNRYASEYKLFSPLNNENSFAALGLVASLGLLFLLGRITLQYRSAQRGSTLDAIALLNMAAVLLGTVGGLGASFAFFFSPWIRCYNRISIFIGFFALLAVAILLEAAWQRWATSRRRNIGFAGFAALFFMAGLIDQTPRHRLTEYRSEEAAFLSDRAFVQQIAAIVPPGKMICQWPHRNYYVDHDMQVQLHSSALSWTHGGLRGQYGDTWNRWLAQLPLEHQIVILCRAEAGGICIDRSAYPDGGAAIVDRLSSLLGPPAVTSSDGRCVFFNLAAATANLKRNYDDEQWAALKDAAPHPPLLFWREGFFEEEQGPLGLCRGASQDAKLILRNGSERTSKVHLRLAYAFAEYGSYLSGEELIVESALCGTKNCELSQQERFIDLEIEVPPGDHVFRFSTDAKPQLLGKDLKRRPIVYKVYQVCCDTTLTVDEENDFCRDIAALTMDSVDR